jgi:hypothetical protein
MTNHWHVGSNRPGCLPESDVDCVETREDAVSILKSNMEWWADQEDNAATEMIVTTVPEDEQEAALAEVSVAAHVGAILTDDGPDHTNDDYSVYVTGEDDRRMVFWLATVTDEQCDHSECAHDEN